MAPEQRVALAAEMSDEIRAITEAGIRHRNPAFTDDEVRAALAVIVLGREDAARLRARRVAPRPVSLAALLVGTIARLERAGVPYMITGSVASSYHGEPRATRDLDIVIDPDLGGIDRLVGELDADGWYVDAEAAHRALADRTQFNAIDATTGWKIDLLVRKDRPFSREEFGRRTRANLLGTPAWIASPEDTIIAKLEWAAASGSDRQLADVAAMLDIGGDSLDLAYIDRWVTGLGLQAAWNRTQAPRSAD